MALMTSKPPRCTTLPAALCEKHFSRRKPRQRFLNACGVPSGGDFLPLLTVSWQALGCSWPSLGRSWPPQPAPGTALWSLFACVMPLWRFSGLAGTPPISIWRLLGPAPAGFSVRPALFLRTLWDPVAGLRCYLSCATAALFVPCGLLLLHRFPCSRARSGSLAVGNLG